MNSIKNWNFRDVVKLLRRNGFTHRRTRGSHFRYIKQEGKDVFLVTVQKHGNKSIPPKTMQSIIRQSGIPKNKWIKTKKETKP